jgi:methionyl-tRNA synthetase
MLQGAGFRKPTAVFCHGFLTVDNLKMSKSRGTSITAETYLRNLEPEYLRYYYAAKLSSSVADLNLNIDDFVTRVNADVIGKVVNIASRCAGFITKKFDGKLSSDYPASEINGYQELMKTKSTILDLYEQREFGKAMREIMLLAEAANTYINDAEPWVKVKNPDELSQVQDICTVGLNYFRIIMTYLTPVLPALSAKTEAFLNTTLSLDALHEPLVDHAIDAYKPMITRIEEKAVEKMIEETKDTTASSATETAPIAAKDIEPIKDTIEIDEFNRIDLRVALIVDAKPVEGADKLLELTLDIGRETRTVFAGIKSAYDATELIGRSTVMVANLKPRKMRFGVSNGMVLAAGPGGSELFILSPDTGAKPGMRVK